MSARSSSACRRTCSRSSGSSAPEARPLSSRSFQTADAAGLSSGGWSVTAAGTIGFDDLTTPAGRARDIPGGSALYFTLAASRHCQVMPVAVLGGDGGELRSLLELPGVDCEGVEVLPGRSYRWTAVHSLDAVPDSEVQSLGVYENWHPRVPARAAGGEVLFLGSMHPQCQLEVLGQCTGANLVALDTMRDFIATERELLLELALACDLLFANRAELAALTGDAGADLDPPARRLLGRGRLKAVVVKEGADGVTLVTSADARRFPAHPVAKVVDPTGAGDSLAGGMLGRLAQLRSSDQAALELALEDGLAAAAQAVAEFGVEGLRRSI